MTPAPNTRGRHALRWVVGVGLVFVVVFGLALQVARQRADERWESVIGHSDEGWGELGPRIVIRSLEATLGNGGLPGSTGSRRTTNTATSGGNIFLAWRQHQWNSYNYILVVRQERSLFGSSIEARMTGGEPALVDAARVEFAAVGVELIVE